MSEKHNFNPFDFDHYSRQVRSFFSKMKKIRNDIKSRYANYNLNESDLEVLLVKLDILVKDKNSESKSIQDYFDEDINSAQGMNESFIVFEKYYKLFQDCYGKSIEQIVKEVNMKSKLQRLESERN